jgi:hypothetical protein
MLIFSFLLAIANHHSNYTKESPEYNFVESWKKCVENVIKSVKFQILQINMDFLYPSLERYEYDKLYFDISQSEDAYYRFYVFLSKILRLSDWRGVESV